MKLLRAWRRAAGVFRARARDREFAEEVQSHLQLHIDDNLRAGLSPEDARRIALAKFGSIAATREAYRERGGVAVLEILSQDLRYGVRRLLRQPGYALVIVLTLALGVGANAAMFGIVDALMFRTPDHVDKPGRLVVVRRSENHVRYEELRERLHSADLAAYTRPRTLSFGSAAGAVPIQTQCITSTFLAVLGVAPVIGRAFAAADDRVGAERNILLSHGFWLRRLGGAPGVLGQTVAVSGRPYRVVGVAPRGFRGLELEPVDAWITIAATPEACSFSGTNLLRSEGSWLTTIGRMRAGTTFEQAVTEITTLEPAASRCVSPTAA